MRRKGLSASHTGDFCSEIYRENHSFILHLPNQKSLFIILPNVKCSRFLQSQLIFLIQYLSLQVFLISLRYLEHYPFIQKLDIVVEINILKSKTWKILVLYVAFHCTKHRLGKSAWTPEPPPVELNHFPYCPRMCEILQVQQRACGLRSRSSR